MNKIALGIGGAFVLMLTACSSGGGHSSSVRHAQSVSPAVIAPSTTPAAVLRRIKECADHSCPADVPRYTVNVFIDGRYVRPGTTKLKIGTPVMITVAMPHPTGVEVSDVYPYIGTDGPQSDGPNGPTGQVRVLASHRGLLSSTDTITAAWTPSALFAKTKLYINVDATMTDAVSKGRIEDTALTLDLVS